MGPAGPQGRHIYVIHACKFVLVLLVISVLPARRVPDPGPLEPPNKATNMPESNTPIPAPTGQGTSTKRDAKRSVPIAELPDVFCLSYWGIAMLWRQCNSITYPTENMYIFSEVEGPVSNVGSISPPCTRAYRNPDMPLKTGDSAALYLPWRHVSNQIIFRRNAPKRVSRLSCPPAQRGYNLGKKRKKEKKGKIEKKKGEREGKSERVV